MAVVQAFTRERAFQREFEGLNEANRVANVHAQKLSSVFFPAIELLGVVAQVAVLYAGARMIDAGSLEIGTLIAAAGMLSLVFQPLQELSELYGQVQAASAAMGKISTVLDAAHDIDRPPATPRDLGRIEGRLELDGVVFAYGDEPVLHGIELDVPAGGCIALVGRVGRRQVDDGEARRALLRPRPGRGARGRDRSSRRAPALATAASSESCSRIRSSSAARSPTTSASRGRRRPTTEIAEAARAIGVDRVAARFEDGLEHVVREGGSGLSAGERQLISIARALVADPRILILDEATSNIDRPSEVLIERAFDTLLRGRTSLIIAHRLATVRRADEIVVLEHGRIVQRGTYDELIGVDGAFRRLATTLEGVDARRVASSGSYSPQSKSRERPQRPSSSAAPSAMSSVSRPRERGDGLGRLDAVERLLEACLLLRLEQRVVLERILDGIAVERHRAVQLGVPLLEVEVLLDRPRERGVVVLGRGVVGEGVVRNPRICRHLVSVGTGRVPGWTSVVGHAAV